MGEVVRVRKTEYGQIVKFTPKKTTKLKKDGTPKQTPFNAKPDREIVHPFKQEDVPKMIEQFNYYIEMAENEEDEIIRRRNKAMFIMGCNIGLRASDLLSLRWCDIYNKEWNFLRGKKIKPKKTSNTKKKNKYVFLMYNESFRNALEEYRKYIDITDMNDYIFESREGGHIQVQTAGKIIKNAAIDVGIKYNVNSHSMRKTLARNIYNKAEDKEDALVRIGEILGHTSTRDTRKYLCLVEEELVECFDLADFGYVIEEEENDD